MLLPVRMTPLIEEPGLPTSPLETVASVAAKTSRAGVIELEFADAQLRLRGAVDEARALFGPRPTDLGKPIQSYITKTCGDVVRRVATVK